MTNWNPRYRSQATNACTLLSLALGAACEWIDNPSNLPSHPNADSFTGYGDLLPAPKLDKPSPDIPPTSWGHPAKQVRLSSVPPYLTGSALRHHLPTLPGLASINQFGVGIFILTFSDDKLAAHALSLLRDTKDPFAAQVETDYETRLTCDSAVFCASTSYLHNPFSTHLHGYNHHSSASSSLSPPATRCSSHLPFATVIGDIVSLLRYARVSASTLDIRPSKNARNRVAHGTLSSPADFVRFSSLLHHSTLHYNRISVHRSPPEEKLEQHPVIMLEGLWYGVKTSDLEGLGEKTGYRTYRYEFVQDEGGYTATGRMRVESGDLAELAVRCLKGMAVVGRGQIVVPWRTASEKKAARSTTPPVEFEAPEQEQRLAATDPPLPQPSSSTLPPPRNTADILDPTLSPSLSPTLPLHPLPASSASATSSFRLPPSHAPPCLSDGSTTTTFTSRLPARILSSSKASSSQSSTALPASTGPSASSPYPSPAPTARDTSAALSTSRSRSSTPLGGSAR
ncbi:hypothetical protein JCM8547_006254 [Rhodosporidiobolus lusitaniae]